MWHWYDCPICGAKGKIEYRKTYVGREEDTYIVGEDDCMVCDGRGVIKVPDGYHLEKDSS